MDDLDPELRPGLDYVFEMRVEFSADRCIFGPLPNGDRQGYTPTSGGLIHGPRLQGKVVPLSGADFATVRSDNVIEINSHYLLEADDGTKIYINNVGYLVPAKPGEGVVSHGTPQPHYFRFTPRFKVPAGPHDWLARTVILGTGSRRSQPADHSIFRYYAVT